MRLDGVVLLASYSARSQAYAQALAARGLAPERVLLFGEPRPPRGSAPSELERATATVFLPDLSVPLEETLRREGWGWEHAEAGSVNDPAVVARLAAARPGAVVYSGYGGQIVGAEALAVAPFLHAHAGWLPEERGSTTLYYGALLERRCGVSVIRLERDIDTGPILARREYPLPAAGSDVDLLYDNAIRADLMADVLERRARGDAETPVAQSAEQGTLFYVIHPVLKHLALLSLPVPVGGGDVNERQR